MRRREFITLVLTLGPVLAIGLVVVQAHAQKKTYVASPSLPAVVKSVQH